MGIQDKSLAYQRLGLKAVRFVSLIKMHPFFSGFTDNFSSIEVLGQIAERVYGI